MQFCVSCGTQLDADTKFCSNCGQAVEDNSAAAPPAPPVFAPGQGMLPPRKKPKGMAVKVIGVLLLAGTVVLLNYFGIPGYVAALVLGLWGATSLLAKNQNGRLRETLAVFAAALLATVMYCLGSGPRFGIYFAAAVFLAAGLGLTRLYKMKPGINAWLLEAAPAVLYFSMFERLGGAVSGVPGVLSGISIGVMVRYAEAALLLAAWIIVQILHNKQASQREAAALSTPKRKKLRGFCKFLLVLALVLLWINPLGILAFDNIKSKTWDWLAGFGTGKSVVSTLSQTNGTSLLMTGGEAAVTNDTAALELLLQYDRELGGEYVFIEQTALPSGNTLYRFAQTSSGIAVEGGAKNLVTDSTGSPLYIVGQSRMIAQGLAVAKAALSESEVRKALKTQFDGFDMEIGSVQQLWYFAETAQQSAYCLAYTAELMFEEEGERTACAVLDAVTGELLNLSFGEDEAALAALLQQAKRMGSFENAAFDEITQAAQLVLAGTQWNAWRYRDVLEQECLQYYASKGSEKQGKKNAAAFVQAFEEAGAKGKNTDEGTIGVELNHRSVKLKGVINFAGDADETIVNSNGNPQTYTITSAVPVTLYVRNTEGQHILTLPVFDMETFELYPSSREERFVLTVQGGSRFQSAAKSAYAPSALMITARAAEDELAAWLEGEVNASYELTMEQLSGSNGNASQNEDELLRKIEAAYNSTPKGSGARYLALYRFDQLSDTAREIYEPVAQLGAGGQMLSKIAINFSGTRWFSAVAQMLLISYRVGNDMIAPMWKGVTASVAQAMGGEGSEFLPSDEEINLMVSDAPDKTMIALSLLMFNGDMEYFNGLFNSSHELFGTLTRLENSTLSLTKLNRSGDEVTVHMVITGPDGSLVDIRLPILIQQFGEATGGQPSDLGADAAWFSSIISGMKDTFSRGTFLGFDMERMFELWMEGFEEDAAPVGDGEGEQGPGKADVTSPPIKSKELSDDQCAFIKNQFNRMIHDMYVNIYAVKSNFSTRDALIQLGLLNQYYYKWSLSYLSTSLKSVGKLYSKPQLATVTVMDFCKDMVLSHPKAFLAIGDTLIVIALYYDYLNATEVSFKEASDCYTRFRNDPTTLNAEKFISAYKEWDSNFYIAEHLFSEVMDALKMTWRKAYQMIWDECKDQALSILLEDEFSLDGIPELLGVAQMMDSYSEAFLRTTGIRSSADERARIIQTQYDNSKTDMPVGWKSPAD